MELITDFPGNSVLRLTGPPPSPGTAANLPVHQTNTPHVPAGYRKVTAPAGVH
jgi:hypothetical protein